MSKLLAQFGDHLQSLFAKLWARFNSPEVSLRFLAFGRLGWQRLALKHGVEDKPNTLQASQNSILLCILFHLKMTASTVG